MDKMCLSPFKCDLHVPHLLTSFKTRNFFYLHVTENNCKALIISLQDYWNGTGWSSTKTQVAPSRPGVSGLGFGFLFQLNSHRLIKSLIKTRQVGAWAGEATESEVSWRCVLRGLCWGLHHCGRREGRWRQLQPPGCWRSVGNPCQTNCQGPSRDPQAVTGQHGKWSAWVFPFSVGTSSNRFSHQCPWNFRWPCG